MPRSVASQRIARHRIAGKPIVAPYGSVNLQAPHPYPPGSHTFTAPITGFWKFVCWSPGASGAAPGASGAYGEKTIRLAAQQTVSVQVGRATQTVTDTVLTHAGSTYTLTAAAGSTAGAASGSWDVSLNGTAGASAGANPGNAGSGTGGGAGGVAGLSQAGGAGAPGVLPYRGGGGGRGGQASGQSSGLSPGGGCGESTNGGGGGDGLVIVYLVRE